MTIHLNSSSNPTAVNYNGTALDLVYASVDGVSSVFPVWQKQMIYPSSLGLIVVSMTDGCKAYFRNMTLDSTFYLSSGGTGGQYSGDVTIETSFAKGRQVGPTSPYTSPYEWLGDGSYQSVTGVPSGYSFYKGESPDSPSVTVAFDVYHWTTPGYFKESEKVATNLQTKVTIDTSGQRFVTQPHGNSWPVLTRSTGWIYQGAGTLTLTKN